MRILIVDDSKAMRMIVMRTLRQAGFGAHTLEEAADGKQALSAIQLSTPDLVLSDWNMPEMLGIELLQALRAAGNSVRFGFVTSEGTEDMKAKAMAAGALFIIVKPFTPEQFKAELGPLLG